MVINWQHFQILAYSNLSKMKIWLVWQKIVPNWDIFTGICEFTGLLVKLWVFYHQNAIAVDFGIILKLVCG